MLEKRVVKNCCRQVLNKSIGEECWREMLDRDSFAAGNEPVPVCVCSSCGRYLFALLARHWLRRCSSCDIGVVQKTTISNLHWGSWVVQVSPWIGTDFFVAPG